MNYNLYSIENFGSGDAYNDNNELTGNSQFGDITDVNEVYNSPGSPYNASLSGALAPARTLDGRIDDVYHHTEAMNYGAMPHGLLESKFEETDIESEGVYNSYAKNLLTDRTPDTNFMAYEEPRGSVTARSGFINFRYNGHRGEAYSPYRPEYFDGFGGGEDRDPRGINVDPDMRELTKQEQARMRFVRFSPDSSESITSGGLSEYQVMANKQKVYRIVRGKLRVFDRQLDGRREGLRRVYAHKSQFSNVQTEIKSYGDVITDYALTPQRRANKICQQVIRDAAGWRAETAEDNFAIMQYGQFGRKKKDCVTFKTVENAMDSSDGKFTDADASKCFKTAGILMANIVNQKKQAKMLGDGEHGESRNSITAKTAPIVRDLIAVTKGIKTDAVFSQSDHTISGKNIAPQQRAHQMRRVHQNHLTPAHHYLNAELMYKSVNETADKRSIQNNMITDANFANSDIVTAAKSAKHKIVTGARLNTADDGDYAESRRTASYKHVRQCNGDKRSRLTSEDGYIGVGDDSQVRRPNQWNHRVVNPNDTVQMADFGHNDADQLRIMAMGTKNTRRQMDRELGDGSMGEIGFNGNSS